MFSPRALKRWMYRGDRPHRAARLMNRFAAWQFRRGLLSPDTWMTLEVTGRRSGRTVEVPVVVLRRGHERYLVSMLGEKANWVANVRAAGGAAVLRRRTRQPVRLVEVPVAGRAPILKAYLAVAPGARPHLPVDRHAPVADFEPIADRYPVFRVERRVSRPPADATGRR